MAEINLADLVGAGVDFFVTSRLQRGGDFSSIMSDLRRQFPSAAENTLRAAYNRGLDTRRAARQFNELGDDDLILARDAPRPTTGRLNWCYAILVHFGDEDGHITESRYVYVNEPEQLTRGQIHNRAAGLAHDLLTDGQPRERYEDIRDRLYYISDEVVGVSRSC